LAIADLRAFYLANRTQSGAIAAKNNENNNENSTAETGSA